MPWELLHVSFTGLLLVNLLFPETFQTVEASGMSIFLLVLTKPLSIKYPSSTFLGFNKVILSLPLSSILYSLKVKSSIAAPFKEIDPTTLPFSNWILLFSFKASVLESFAKFSFLSKLGVSVLFSIFFVQQNFAW